MTAQLAQAGRGFVGQMDFRRPARLLQWDDVGPFQQLHTRVDLTGDRCLQMVEAFVQGLALGRVEPFEVLDALVYLRGDTGAQGPHPMQAEGMVTAQGVLQGGHVLLEFVPGRQKQFETMMADSKRMFRAAVRRRLVFFIAGKPFEKFA